MPIIPPSLDDRSFDDLVGELLARIPAHAPEYTNPRPGDPGRTLIELFAWLADTILYRANLIPERQRLAFLRLLGMPLQAAVPATGLVSVRFDDDLTVPVTLGTPASIAGPVPFETLAEVTVLPLAAEGYFKRPLTPDENGQLDDRNLRDDLAGVYGVTDPQQATFYVTTPVFAGGAAEPGGFDLVGDTVDGSLWLALLARTPEKLPDVRAALDSGDGARILNVGIVPRLQIPPLVAAGGALERVEQLWEISTGREINGQPEYLPLEKIADGTGGLTQSGVVRLVLPAADNVGALPNDVRVAMRAGAGERPPRLDDPQQAARLLAWLRLRPADAIDALALNWVGINGVTIDQRQTLERRNIGTASGQPDLTMPLPAGGASVEEASFALEVAEPGESYVGWDRIDDLALAERDARVFELDPEAATVTFGDGVRGRAPAAGSRVRVLSMRAGGGAAGNLPAGTLTKITGFDATSADRKRVARLMKVLQPLPTAGGADSETLAEAEQRIPAFIRHRDRAVTADDYRRLAAETPGVEVARVEVMPQFVPAQLRSDVPGTLSVVVLPAREGFLPPNPRPDRRFLQMVQAWLDDRRPLATQLFTIGCAYKPIALSVGVLLRSATEQVTTLAALRDALRQHLWPLLPGGPLRQGWPLGRSVRDREIEVVVAQVPGIAEVTGVRLFGVGDGGWVPVTTVVDAGAIAMSLDPWELPELRDIVVTVGAAPRADINGSVPNPMAPPGGGVPVPFVPEVC